jgi:hypothetical protein
MAASALSLGTSKYQSPKFLSVIAAFRWEWTLFSKLLLVLISHALWMPLWPPRMPLRPDIRRTETLYSEQIKYSWSMNSIRAFLFISSCTTCWPSNSGPSGPACQPCFTLVEFQCKSSNFCHCGPHLNIITYTTYRYYLSLYTIYWDFIGNCEWHGLWCYGLVLNGRDWHYCRGNFRNYDLRWRWQQRWHDSDGQNDSNMGAVLIPGLKRRAAPIMIIIMEFLKPKTFYLKPIKCSSTFFQFISLWLENFT